MEDPNRSIGSHFSPVPLNYSSTALEVDQSVPWMRITGTERIRGALWGMLVVLSFFGILVGDGWFLLPIGFFFSRYPVLAILGLPLYLVAAMWSHARARLLMGSFNMLLLLGAWTFAFVQLLREKEWTIGLYLLSSIPFALFSAAFLRHLAKVFQVAQLRRRP